MHPIYNVLPVAYVPVRLHSVLGAYIGILTRLLTAEPLSNACLLFLFQCLSGRFLLTLYWCCGTGRFYERGHCLFIRLSACILLLRRPHSWALSLTVSRVVISSSHVCLVFLSLSAILWPYGLLPSCVCFLILSSWHIWGYVNPSGVFPLFLKMVADIIAPKRSIFFFVGSSV